MHIFAGYPTRTLGRDSVVALVDADAEATDAQLRSYLGLLMVSYAASIFPAEDDIAAVVWRAAGPQTADARRRSALSPSP